MAGVGPVSTVVVSRAIIPPETSISLAVLPVVSLNPVARLSDSPVTPDLKINAAFPVSRSRSPGLTEAGIFAKTSGALMVIAPLAVILPPASTNSDAPV